MQTITDEELLGMGGGFSVCNMGCGCGKNNCRCGNAAPGSCGKQPWGPSTFALVY